MPSIILVAGMHRSGTSALTRAINLAGVPLPSILMPASPEQNADGFWESADLWEIHEAILRSLKSGWNDPREIPGAWFDSRAADDARGKLTGWIDKEMHGNDRLLVKDPRTCRLLPLWQDVCATLGIETYTVIPFRNPIEVARSLKARDGFPEALSFFLWLRHVLDAERFSRGKPRVFASFDQLMGDGVATVRRIGSELRLTFATPEHELRDLLGATLKPALRHHVVTDDAVTEAARQIPPLLTTYRWMLDAAEGRMPPFGPLDEFIHLMRASEQARGVTIAMPGVSAASPAG